MRSMVEGAGSRRRFIDIRGSQLRFGAGRRGLRAVLPYGRPLHRLRRFSSPVLRTEEDPTAAPRQAYLNRRCSKPTQSRERWGFRHNPL